MLSLLDTQQIGLLDLVVLSTLSVDVDDTLQMCLCLDTDRNELPSFFGGVNQETNMIIIFHQQQHRYILD